MDLLLLAAALVLYLLATAAFVTHLMLSSDSARRAALAALAAGFVLSTGALMARAGQAMGLQLTHDQLAILAWFLVAVYLLLQFRYRLAVVGALVSPLAFLLTLAAYVVYSGDADLSGSLGSAWLPAHVAPAFLGYAILVVAACLSSIYLLQERQLKAKRVSALAGRLPSLETLDDLSYRCVVWGFALFTIGIVTGAVLSKVAWGTFWSWEPVQILSVLAWLLYALLLQSRAVGWRGRRAATLTLAGFVLLVVSFLSLSLGLSHGSAVG